MTGIETIARGEFPKSVLDQASIASRIRTSSYLARRLDLRGKTVFAFASSENSPSECAFSLYRNGSGWQLTVHVADVCEYVCEGSPLDSEAKARCARLSNGFEHSEMLPDIIVSDLCDLTKSGDKLAVSVIMDISADGKLADIQVEESVIRIAGKCVYGEIDQLGLTSDASSVMQLRKKYAAFGDMIIDMYELAALFCIERRKRGGLDCTNFLRVYERDESGKITVFRRESEPDSRAMVREIGYFAAEAVGKFMVDRNLPCIFNGREGVNEKTLDYLSDFLGASSKANNPAKRAAEIADLAKGSPYYGFVCDMLAASVPRAVFSTAPMNNAFCGCDHIVSFFNPATHYTDLLIQRVLRSNIAAGNPKNLNLNRHKKTVEEAAAQANIAESYVFDTQRRFSKLSALEFVENNINGTFDGFPIYIYENGSVLVMMECGLLAMVPSEYAKDTEFKVPQPKQFKILALGTEDEHTVITPL